MKFIINLHNINKTSTEPYSQYVDLKCLVEYWRPSGCQTYVWQSIILPLYLPGHCVTFKIKKRSSENIFKQDILIGSAEMLPDNKYLYHS